MTGTPALTAEDIAGRIPDGAKLAVFKDRSCAMDVTRALVRRGARDLHLVCVPTSGFQAELLVAGGCVATIETSGVSLGEHGAAPAFARAVKSGALRIMDSTCPAIYAQLQAAEKGTPFAPLRGIIGSDILGTRPDYKVIQNPFEQLEDPIVVLPALSPDIALFHAPFADEAGNVWIGRQPELKLMAHAARETLVTVEEIRPGNLMEDETLAAAAIPAFYVNAVAKAPRGAAPLALPGHYDDDAGALRAYAAAAKTGDGLAAWLEANIFAPDATGAAAE